MIEELAWAVCVFLYALVSRVLAALKQTAADFVPWAVALYEKGKILFFESENRRSSAAMRDGWLEAAGTFMLVPVWPAYALCRFGCVWYACVLVLLCAVIFIASLPICNIVRGAGAVGTLYVVRKVCALDLRWCAVLFALVMFKMSSWVHGLGLQFLFLECKTFTRLRPQKTYPETQKEFEILKTNTRSIWKKPTEASFYLKMFQLCMAECKQNELSDMQDKMLLFRHMFMPLMTCRLVLMFFVEGIWQSAYWLVPQMIAMLDLTPIDWRAITAKVAGAFETPRVLTEAEEQLFRQYYEMQRNRAQGI